jgi:hypothetical protein
LVRTATSWTGEFWCSDDDAAKAQAAQLVNGHDVELWQQGRKVADFKHKD